MAARALARYSKLKGSVFGAFRGEKNLVNNHWLDTNRDKYYETINKVVIPDCMSIAAEVPGYPERVEKFLKYTIPLFHDAWNFSVELLYRTVADPAHQTEENITKMYILRAVMDMLFNLLGVMDDCTDRTEWRVGKPSWQTICEGGVDAAYYDGALMSLFPLYVLKQHFRNDPGYIRLFETTAMALDYNTSTDGLLPELNTWKQIPEDAETSLEKEGGTALMIGQTLDILGQKSTNPDLREFSHCYTYKGGKFISPAGVLGLVHAGIEDEEILTRSEKIFHRIGKMLQVWDDFNEYFSPEEVTNKQSSDFQNATTTWITATAMNILTPSQVKEFKECFGSSDPAKVNRIRELYHEINMDKHYVDHMAQNYKQLKAEIREIQHPKVREACDSYVEWLVGKEVLTA